MRHSLRRRGSGGLVGAGEITATITWLQPSWGAEDGLTLTLATPSSAYSISTSSRLATSPAASWAKSSNSLRRPPTRARPRRTHQRARAPRNSPRKGSTSLGVPASPRKHVASISDPPRRRRFERAFTQGASTSLPTLHGLRSSPRADVLSFAPFAPSRRPARRPIRTTSPRHGLPPLGTRLALVPGGYHRAPAQLRGRRPPALVLAAAHPQAVPLALAPRA